jgi:D-alanyl-D-alanine carboxypeptidase/D-alanyl-D-alanine-endopeptidase (penicillin-binding protein 4)
LLASCSTTRRSKRYFQKKLKTELENAAVFKKSFTGFQLIDAVSGQEYCAVNADKYFVPASNTKILTLAASLAVLGDSIPRFRFAYGAPDTSEPEGIYFVTGTGDPTTLHPNFQAWQQLPDFFQAHPWAPRYFLIPEGSKKLERFGPGWMWDDFPSDYSAENSVLPVYGNMLTLCWDGVAWTALPDTFRHHILPIGTGQRVQRRALEPGIEVPAVPKFPAGRCFDIPMHNPGLLAYRFLQDSVPVATPPFVDGPEARLREFTQSWYATPVDTVYRRLMHQSDNFIAEQLLLVCAGVKFDTFQQTKVIAWAKDSLFAGFPNPPRWVDGSGLSRYNLINPRFLTAVLRKLYQEQPRARLFSLFPAGGVSGTIQNWYGDTAGGAYVFAKTGSMSGVHCLSGYLVAKSGKVLIFSFMHNNFVGSNAAWKVEMQRLLRLIWLHG